MSEALQARFALSAPALAQRVTTALAGSDRDETRAALYALRSEAAAFGAVELARYCRRVEDALGHAPVEVLKEAAATLCRATLALAAGEALPPLDAAPLLPPGGEPACATPSSSDDAVWTPAVDPDMVEPFIEETSGRLDSLAQKVLQLESAPEDLELVRDVMRDLHTIKGSSAFVGLRRLNRVAHRAEDLVARVRDGALAPDRRVVDALLAAGDVMRELLDRAAAGRPLDLELAPILERLAVSGTFGASARAGGADEAGEAEAPTHAATADRPHAGPAARRESTLRVDFEKLDLLLNLVGELVLGRNALGAGIAGLGSLSREVEAQRRLARRAGLGRTVTAAERKALLRTLADELSRSGRVFDETVQDLEDAALRLRHTSEQLRDQVMKLRMVPIARLLGKYHRTVRELAAQLGKQAHVEIEGAETEIDKMVVEQLDEPLLHLLRNALDHGVEPPAAREAAGKPAQGTVRIAASQRGSQIVLQISDDGAGIDAGRVRRKAEEKQLLAPAELAQQTDEQILDLIFRPGFSTAARVSEISGRGVGMDVVRETLGRLKGTVEVASQPGRGTTFTLKLPLTLAIIQVLLLRAGGELVALPLDRVTRTLEVPKDVVRRLTGRPTFVHEGRDVPLIGLGEALGLAGGDERDPSQPLLVVLVEMHGEPFGLVADRFEGKREVVIKGMGTLLEEVPGVAGATLVGDRVVLIVDVTFAVAFGLRVQAAAPARAAAPRQGPPLASARGPRKRILLVEDSDVIRRTLARVLREAGYEVVEARDGLEALQLAARQRFDLISTDVAMPNLDGYELVRRLRARPELRQIPILMVTARAERIDRVRGFDAGVDEYIVKPLDRGELLRAVGKHLVEDHAGRPLP
jgi:chemotaxis protein histidine kinase CheA/ActR/RegA family two-component response regulator